VKEAGERIFQLTSIRRSKPDVEVFVRLLRMPFCKAVNSDDKETLKTTLTLNFHIAENQYVMTA
jgi:hypothetical protein